MCRDRKPFCPTTKGTPMRRLMPVALLLVALAGLGFARAAAAAEIVIGAVYPLSGNLAKTGLDIKDAIELAAELVNADVDVNVPLGKGKGLTNLGGATI